MTGAPARSCRVHSCYRMALVGLEFCSVHGWNGNEAVPVQLDVFQRVDEVADVAPVVPVDGPPVRQLTGLPGSSWTDLFDGDAA